MAQHYKKESITRARVNVFLGWENFNTKGNVPPNRRDQNLFDKVWSKNDHSSIQLSVCQNVTTLEQPGKKFLNSLQFTDAKIGDKYGPTFTTHVFKLNITVPTSMKDEIVHLIWDSNSEALVLTEDGVPRQGLVGGDHWARRADYDIFNGAKVQGGEQITLYVEVACNGLFGAGRGGDIEPPDMNRFYELEECCLAVFNPTAWDLLHDVTLLARLAEKLPQGVRRVRALQTANEVVNVVDVKDKNTFEKGREVARTYLSQKNGEGQSLVHSMLHSHIDLAWLWPMAATPAKGVRTFATHLRLMEKYDECVYVQSQAQLYAWVKKAHPSLWTELQKRITEGRFVPVGGTWVEMDCNIPCGESLVRQFLYGQTFFRKEFGKECKEFWLPDTFGYSAQLPQIMKGCRIDRFMTIKLSWNTFNRFPHSTFVWEGLDGSKVVAHMPPADTYNAQAFPEEVINSATKNKDSAVLNSAIMLVGHGDGGGGASPSMLESMRRMKDLDGVPKVEFSTPNQFFDEVEKKSEELPRWVGELYFELHRGTYTSQAQTKKNNRECETLLRDLEILSSTAFTCAHSIGEKYEYPMEVVESSWKQVLKNCFHDTLPGSSIAMVYKETDADYTSVKNACTIALSDALSSCYTSFLQTGNPNEELEERTRIKRRKISSGNGATNSATNGSESHMTNSSLALISRGTGGLMMNNDIRVLETCIASEVLPEDTIVQRSNLTLALSKKGKQGFGAQSSVVMVKKYPHGVGIQTSPELVSKHEHAVKEVKLDCVKDMDGQDVFVLSNGLVQAVIAKSGRVRSLKLLCPDDDTKQCPREALKQERGADGGGNRLVVYDDLAQFWCGWDTEVYSFEKSWDIGAAGVCLVRDNGPLQASLYLEYPPTKAGSTVEQEIVLRAGSARLDFRTRVNWRESRKILRVIFPTNVRSPYANYDSQFGYIQRPTTFNHSWEIAKFEVVGHQFCDLSEPNFGVALLNNCKYGYSVRDSIMRLSLLRAAKSPDDNADIGVHEMIYSILPHWDSFPTRKVRDEAADLNSPPVLKRVESGAVPEEGIDYTFRLGNNVSKNWIDSVIISTVKKAENSEDIVVRAYESMGARGYVGLELPFNMMVKQAFLVNMLEEPVGMEDLVVKMVEGRPQIELFFTPFQVQTVMLSLK